MAGPSYNVGSLRLTVVSDGTAWLDAGAVFGLVPKLMWSRVTGKTNERNQVPLALNCVLLESDGKTVLIETSGACDIAPCDPRAIKIVDIKTPDSGEQDRIDWSVLERLGARDAVKFVICSRRDYEWARQVLGEHALDKRVAAVLFSPVHAVPPGKELPGVEALPIEDLAQWVLEDRLPVRIQTQLHKQIWDPMARGV